MIDMMTPQTLDAIKRQDPALRARLAPAYYGWLAIGAWARLLEVWLAPARIWIEVLEERSSAGLHGVETVH